MHYFYCDLHVNSDTARISEPEQVHHLRDVLRLKPGERITVLDNAGNEYLCAITSLDKNGADLAILERKNAAAGRARLAVACAVPKLSGMDEIIDKLTQLDVDVIIPLKTERVIVRLPGADRAGGLNDRLERWRKIGRSAAEQSHRKRLPVITGVLNMSEVMEQSRQYRLRLIPTLAGSRKTLREAAAGPHPVDTIVLIGPEGDFTPDEVEQAVSAGFTAIDLGETVLRVDTAAIAAASYLRLAAGKADSGELAGMPDKARE
jgi:16S rRNA (uracil1498-N3)-methyltransferase